MHDNQSPEPGQSQPTPGPRRFVYRSIEPEAQLSHPTRRKTDTPHPFQGLPGQVCPHLTVLKMRVYLKLN